MVVNLRVIVLRLHHGDCAVLRKGINPGNKRSEIVSAAEEQETAARAVCMYA
jgi:hypothetical protein